jgi:hypothetical protein
VRTTRLTSYLATIAAALLAPALWQASIWLQLCSFCSHVCITFAVCTLSFASLSFNL